MKQNAAKYPCEIALNRGKLVMAITSTSTPKKGTREGQVQPSKKSDF